MELNSNDFHVSDHEKVRSNQCQALIAPVDETAQQFTHLLLHDDAQSDTKHVKEILDFTKLKAQSFNETESGLLFKLIHDLNQPLQSLATIREMLAKTAGRDVADKLMQRFDHSLAEMKSFLDAFSRIDHSASGSLSTELGSFPINDMLERLKDEFGDRALAMGLSLRIVGCRHFIRGDPQLLRQMTKNLLSNALKHTKSGKVLLGCHKRQNTLRIEVWDTGDDISDEELKVIFGECQQLESPARERNLLQDQVLPNVRLTGKLLGHSIEICRRPGSGSTFTIKTPLAVSIPAEALTTKTPNFDRASKIVGSNRRTILVIQDDISDQNFLNEFLLREGYVVTNAKTSAAAFCLVNQDQVRPDLILTDCNPPNGVNSLGTISKIWDALNYEPPTIALTGVTSPDIVRSIAWRKFTQVKKPIVPAKLASTIKRLLKKTATSESKKESGSRSNVPTVCLVGEDKVAGSKMRDLLTEAGYSVAVFTSAEAFLLSILSIDAACLLVDAGLPGMSGLELIQKLEEIGKRLPTIMINGSCDAELAVQSVKTGVVALLQKPVARGELLGSVNHAVELSCFLRGRAASHEEAQRHIECITERQREIMNMVLAGHPSKNIAADLGISQRTVENHRASIMKRTGAKSLPALARLAMTAAEDRTSMWPHFGFRETR